MALHFGHLTDSGEMIQVLFAVIAGATFLVLYFQSKVWAKLPPGPWGHPLVGHLLLMGDFPVKVLLKWKKTYGPIFTINFGSYRSVVLSDAKLLREAFNIPGLCDRPDLSIYKGGCGGAGILFSDYEPNREQRRFMLKNIKLHGLQGDSFENKIRNEVSDVLETLDKYEGMSFRVHRSFDCNVVNSLWSCLMSDRFPTGDPNLNHLVSLVKRVSEIPGVLAFLGLFMPWLGKLFPNLTSVNSGLEAKRKLEGFMEEKIQERNESRIPNQPRDVSDSYLDKIDQTDDLTSTFHAKRQFQPTSTGDLFYASLETVGSSLDWTILNMCLHPEVQQKMRNQIVQITGNSRSPALSDRPQMPYVEAVIHEVLRLATVAPLGLPHSAGEDVEFQGYLIPKGTMIVTNLWGIHHDQEFFPGPDSFIPERFLDEDGQFLKNPNFLAFGGGRRVCLGEAFARDELFLFVTSIFQKYNVRFASATNPPKCKFEFVLQPEPFDVIFTKI